MTSAHLSSVHDISPAAIDRRLKCMERTGVRPLGKVSEILSVTVTVWKPSRKSYILVWGVLCGLLVYSRA